MNAQMKAPAPIPPGLYAGESEATYHADRADVLSCSGMKQLLRTPAHYRAWAAGELEKDETPAQRFGKALHMALLEPERFATVYGVLPANAPRDLRYLRNAKKISDDTQAAIDFWDDWDGRGLRTISSEDMARCLGMQASVRAHPWAARLLRNGQSEVSIRWVDEETGLRCKARADYYVEAPARFVLDVKTCTDASPEGFGRAIENYKYHLQHAHYVDGFRSLGLPLAGYYLLAIESDAPYVCQPYYLEAEDENDGFLLRNQAAAVLKRCIETGKYPGYSEDLLPIRRPAWARRQKEPQA